MTPSSNNPSGGTIYSNILHQQPAAGPFPAQEIEYIANTLAEYAPDYHQTDLGNAYRFRDLNSRDVRYVYAWGHYVAFDGTRWLSNGDALAHRLAEKVIKSLHIEAANANEERRRELARFALSVEGRNKLENMLHLAKPYLEIDAGLFDSHPLLLNCENGTLDLSTGELLPHNRGNFLTRLTSIPFLPDAECPRWLAFLGLITAGDDDLQHYLQLAIGYCLTGRTDEHKLFYPYGLGANGKTTFLEAIRMLAGEYAQRIDTEALLLHGPSGEGAKPFIASLQGCRVAIASEMPEGRKLSESLVKDVTGGDSIATRRLYGDVFTFQPTHKLWLFGNYKPKIEGDDLGIWRRIQIIPFNTTIEHPRPMAEVLEEFREELPGILAWAVRGALEWRGNGLPDPPAVRDATAAYKNEQDVLQQFIQSCCQARPDYQEDKKRFYAAYKTWCIENGETAKSQSWLVRRMERRGFELGGMGRSKIVGIRLSDKSADI